MRNRSTVLVLGAAQFVMVLDTTVMNVSISNVVADLHTTVAKMQLAITAYTLVMAALMLTGAKLGDIWGRRRTFKIGLCVYGLGSLTTALSPNINVLLLGWSGVEGVGAVLVIPAIAALTAASYSGTERALAFGLLGGIAGAAAAAGPLIGGAVTTALSWRVVFAGEVVVVLVVLRFVGRIAAAPPAGDGDGARLDLVGTVLSALGLGLAVFGILQISQWGFFKPIGALTIGGTQITPFGFSAVPFVIAAGIVVLGVFARWEQHVVATGGTPLLAPDLLGVRQLRAGLWSVVSQYLILAGTFFVLPLYLQLVLEENAFHTGLKLLPISVTLVFAALAGPRVAQRISPRAVVRIGMGFLLVSIFGVMSTVSLTLATVPFALSLGGFGFGIGLVISQLGNIVMSSVPESRSSEAGGVQGTAQNLGQSLGTALIGAVLLLGLTTGFQQRVQANRSIPPAVKQQLNEGTEGGLAMVSRSTARSTLEKAGLPPEQVSAVVSDYEAAQIEALKRALLWACSFVLVGLWFARSLPDKPLARASPQEARVERGERLPQPAA